MKDVAAVGEAYFTPAFLSPRKAVWWKNAGFLPRNGPGGPSEAVKEALERLAKEIAAAPPQDGTFLAITAKTLSRTSLFAKTLAGVAEFVEFKTLKPWEAEREAVGRALDFAGGLGLSFAQGAVEAFVAKTGADSRTIVSELEKLRCYLGDGRNTVETSDVSAIVSEAPGSDSGTFEISDALGYRDAARLAAALRKLEGSGAFSLLATNAAERLYRSLVCMKDAASRGRLGDATVGLAPFVAKKNAGFLDRWTLQELRVARARIVALRERAVTVSGDTTDALVVAELFRVCRRRAVKGGAAR